MRRRPRRQGLKSTNPTEKNSLQIQFGFIRDSLSRAMVAVNRKAFCMETVEDPAGSEARTEQRKVLYDSRKREKRR
jgi:hypothetical protein